MLYQSRGLWKKIWNSWSCIFNQKTKMQSLQRGRTGLCVKQQTKNSWGRFHVLTFSDWLPWWDFPEASILVWKYQRNTSFEANMFILLYTYLSCWHSLTQIFSKISTSWKIECNFFSLCLNLPPTGQCHIFKEHLHFLLYESCIPRWTH